MAEIHPLPNAPLSIDFEAKVGTFAQNGLTGVQRDEFEPGGLQGHRDISDRDFRREED